MKKAQAIFSLIMLFAFLYLLFVAIVRVSDVESRTVRVGELELKLKTKYFEVEKALFYLEQSGRYSLYSIVEGIKENLSICNKSYEENIANLLDNKLKEYLLNYEEKSIIFPPLNNYEITIIDSGATLIANTKSNLVIKFSEGNYSINPSFSAPFGYDVNKLCS